VSGNVFRVSGAVYNAVQKTAPRGEDGAARRRRPRKEKTRRTQKTVPHGDDAPRTEDGAGAVYGMDHSDLLSSNR
jgi:hypothetical protein